MDRIAKLKKQLCGVGLWPIPQSTIPFTKTDAPLIPHPSSLIPLKASTIVEVVTAALLVMISLGIGMMIYANVLTGEGMIAKTQAGAALSRIAEETAYQQLFISEQIELPNMLVDKQIGPYLPEYPDAILLTLTAYSADKSKKICELKQVIYADAPR